MSDQMTLSPTENMQRFDKQHNMRRRLRRRHFTAANLANIQDAVDALANREGMHVETFTAELQSDVQITIVLKQGVK